MRMTVYTDYALRVLMFLSGTGQTPVPLRAIAAFHDISEEHVRKAAHELVQRGYLTSYRGRTGGVTLARAPEDINVGEVVRALERVELVGCMQGERATCTLMPGCRLSGALSLAAERFLQTLDDYSLADLVAPPGAPSRAPEPPRAPDAPPG